MFGCLSNEATTYMTTYTEDPSDENLEAHSAGEGSEDEHHGDDGADQRRSSRVNILCRMKIFHPSFGEKHVNVRDVSDEGVYLLLDVTTLPSMGSVMQGQVQGLLEHAPMLSLKIVRYDEDGVGLLLVDDVE